MLKKPLFSLFFIVGGVAAATQDYPLKTGLKAPAAAAALISADKHYILDEKALQPPRYAFYFSADKNPEPASLSGLYQIQSFSATENYAGFRLNKFLEKKILNNWLCFPSMALPEETARGLQSYSTLIFPLNKLNQQYDRGPAPVPLPVPWPIPFLVSGSTDMYNFDLRYVVAQEFEGGAETVYISFDWSDDLELMAEAETLKNFMPFFKPCEKL